MYSYHNVLRKPPQRATRPRALDARAARRSGPRKMSVILPHVQASGERLVCQATGTNSDQPLCTPHDTI